MNPGNIRKAKKSPADIFWRGFLVLFYATLNYKTIQNPPGDLAVVVAVLVVFMMLIFMGAA